MLAALIPVLGPIVGKVVGSLFPNPEDQLKRDQAQIAFQQALFENATAIERAAADIVKAEAQGESWIQRSWRPILMLTFGGLIVARWLGFVAPNLTEAEYLKLWSIIELGLGGYVVGRSAEKVLPGIAAALNRK